MKAVVSSRIKKTAKAAAINDTREMLKQVKITDTEAVAADGFILVVRTLDKPSGLKEGESILAPASILGNPILNLKKGQAKEITFETAEGNPSSRVEISANAKLGLMAQLETGTYPNYVQLLEDAKKNAPTAKVGFTVAILKKLLSAVDDSEFIGFRICGPHQPVMFKAGESKGIIMPAVINDSSDPGK